MTGAAYTSQVVPTKGGLYYVPFMAQEITLVYKGFLKSFKFPYLMRIGNVKIEGKLFLAHMSNVTSLPFRLLCKRYGAAIVYSEMINAEAFIRESEKTIKRCYFTEEERPVGIQLSGSSEEALIKAIKKAETELKPDLVDINIGCPAYNVMKSGCGASLLKEPERLGNIVSSLSSAISIPLTCKIRITNDD